MRTTFKGLPGLTHKTASNSYECILSRVPMIITSYKIYDWRKPTIFQKNNQIGHRIPIRKDLSHAKKLTSLCSIPYWGPQTVMQLCCGWRVGNGKKQRRSQDAVVTEKGLGGFSQFSPSHPLTCPVFNQWGQAQQPHNFPGQSLCPMIGMVMSRPILSRCVHWLAISCWLGTNF